jgi:CBS domain-containing protein
MRRRRRDPEVPPEVLADVTDLLAACPAFRGVDRGALRGLATDSEIGYLATSGPPERPALVVMRGGLTLRDRDGRAVDVVNQGEYAAPADGQVVEPVESGLVLWLPERARDLAWSVPVTDLAQVRVAGGFRDDLTATGVRSVMRSPVLTARPAETCRAAAERMREEHVSSLLVVDPGRAEGDLGILTDRDLRSRLVAQGRSADTPVGEMATFPARTVDAKATAFEALLEMLSHGIHHLPVSERGRVVGMVSSGDLNQLQGRSPLRVQVAVDRAENVDAVADAVRLLPDSVAALLGGAGAQQAARVVAATTDRVHRKILRLAFAERGEPPGDYGWLAFGSQARREQTLLTDQDTGLLLPDGLTTEQLAWWEDTAAWVVEALERCGYPPCRGGVMASRPAWRHDATGWQHTITAVVRTPTEQHLLRSAIVFDLRTVSGAMDAERHLGPTIAGAQGDLTFLARLTRVATAHRPPLGFFGRFAVERSGEHVGAFDVKAGAMLPITDLARLVTLARGGREVGTEERLLAAAETGAMSADLAATLRAGHALATGLRLARHVEQHRAGLPLDNWLEPGELEPLVRSQLRETFKAVRTAQDHLANRYRISLLA